MTKTLHQQKGKNYKKFAITADYLQVERKRLGSFDRYRLSWKEIDFDAVVQGRAFEIRQTFTLISLVVNVVFAFWLACLLWPGIWGRWWLYVLMVFAALAFVPFVIELFKAERNMILYGESNVSFYYREEDEEAVEDFIEAMKIARAKYLRRNFLHIDELLPLDEHLNAVRQLYINDMITRDDLIEVMEQAKVRRLFED